MNTKLTGSEWMTLIKPDEEFPVEMAKVTADKVLVRKDGLWIELRPTARRQRTEER